MLCFLLTLGFKDAGFFLQYKAAFETVKRGYTDGMRASSFKNNEVIRKFNKSLKQYLCGHRF